MNNLKILHNQTNLIEKVSKKVFNGKIQVPQHKGRSIQFLLINNFLIKALKYLSILLL